MQSDQVRECQVKMRNDSRDTFGGVTFQLSYKIYAALRGKSQKAMDQTALTMRESESPGSEGLRLAGDRWVGPVVHPGRGEGVPSLLPYSQRPPGPQPAPSRL